MKRFLLITAGIIMLGIGAIAIILPILPTFPFLLVASICFLKSSERLNMWFKGTRMYQKHVEPFIRQKGLTLKAKLFIIIPVAVMLITLCILYDNLAIRIVIGVLLAIKIIVFIKMKTIKEIPTNDAKQEADISMCKK